MKIDPMTFEVAPDGRLINGGQRPCVAGEVEIDEVAPHKPGDRLIRDPDNPRRAIVAPPPVPTYAEQRAKEYPSADALIVALWERIVEGRPEASVAIQAQRAAIKAKYPKP
jgi:hypothetical protein